MNQIAYKLLLLFYLTLFVKLNRKRFVIALSFGILSLILIGNSCSLSYGQDVQGTKFGRVVPKIYPHDLKVEEVFLGLHFPTRMAFVGPDDILVIEKNNGTVSRILNGTISSRPILDVNVATKMDRGMVGIAVLNGLNRTYVFLYFTEADSKDGGKALGNRLYRYQLQNDKLIRPKLLLDLPATPGPIHNGGAIIIGPDGNVYLSVGDIHGSCDVNVTRSCHTVKTKTQNYHNGDDVDGRAGILRVTPDGDTVGSGILGNSDPLNKYYAYGIRNSFGLDFDPVTGNLWDTENGPYYGDEINLVKPGFNSGWDKVAGIWKPNGTFNMGDITLKPNNLEDFGGKGKYSAPEFIWSHTIGPTAITFVDTDKLGKQYQDDLLVGDVHNGRLWHFDLNENRTGLSLKGELADKIANYYNETAGIVLGDDFGEITDIKVGPDGYVYVVVYSKQYGEILRIVPADTTPKSPEK